MDLFAATALIQMHAILVDYRLFPSASQTVSFDQEYRRSYWGLIAAGVAGWQNRGCETSQLVQTIKNGCLSL
jgi:hypothetical protein